MEKKAIGYVVVLVGVLLFGGMLLYGNQVFAQSSAVDEVLIGAVYPLSGASAAAGKDFMDAATLAVEIINGRFEDIPLPMAASEGLPNLGGAKIRVIFADHQGDVNIARSEAERLITSRGVVAIQGPYQSGAAATMMQVTERYGVPTVLDSSSSPTLMQRGYEWSFRVAPHDGLMVGSLFEYLEFISQENDIEVETVGLIWENTLFGQDNAELFRQNAKKYGLRIVADLPYTATSPSLDAEVQRLKIANPDVLLAASYTSDAILLVKTLERLRWSPKVFLASDAGFNQPEFLSAGGREAEGVVTRATGNIDQRAVNPRFALIADMFMERFGRPLADIPAQVFTSTLLIADAINQAGTTEPEAIREVLRQTALETTDIIMPWPGIKFDENGDNERAVASILQVQDGQLVTIYPLEFATAEARLPLLPWTER